MSILTMEVCLAALLGLVTLGTALGMVRKMKRAGRHSIALPALALIRTASSPYR
jgi:methylthioribose-1-phosphate isomerase